jgi:DNA-binding NarL/FixJ family response regulator
MSCFLPTTSPRQSKPSRIYSKRRTLMLRILIADDHDVVRAGLRRVLEAQPGWEVVAEATDGKDAVTKAVSTKPDVAVLDCMMPLLNGAEATRQIRARVPKTQVLMFTIHEDERLIEESLRAGARGYVLKSDLTGQLIQAVRSLSEHKPFFTSTVSETLLSSMLTAQIEDGIRLSYEERTVVRLFAQGHKNRELADILNMSLKSVENRRTTIMRKLKLPSSAALVLYAIRNRLVEP